MRRFSKPSADRIASIRIDLLQQNSCAPNDEDVFRALVQSNAVLSSLDQSLVLLFGHAAACTLTLSGANLAARELAVHVHNAGGGGSSKGSLSSSSSSSVCGGVDQLRAACSLITALPVSDRTRSLLQRYANDHCGSGGGGKRDDGGNTTGGGDDDEVAAIEEERDDEDFRQQQQQSLAAQLRRFVVKVVGSDGFVDYSLPCRLTVARVK